MGTLDPNLPMSPLGILLVLGLDPFFLATVTPGGPPFRTPLCHRNPSGHVSRRHEFTRDLGSRFRLEDRAKLKAAPLDEKFHLTLTPAGQEQ